LYFVVQKQYLWPSSAARHEVGGLLPFEQCAVVVGTCAWFRILEVDIAWFRILEVDIAWFRILGR
jgi:hypothetical protein